MACLLGWEARVLLRQRSLLVSVCSAVSMLLALLIHYRLSVLPPANQATEGELTSALQSMEPFESEHKTPVSQSLGAGCRQPYGHSV